MDEKLYPQSLVEDCIALGLDPELALSPGHLNFRMGIRILEASPQRVVATMPVGVNTQAYGMLHGGASAVLAETLGSIGSLLHAGPSRMAFGVDLNCTHHRGVHSGQVTGTATALHLGRSSTTYETVISDEAGRRVCTARLTSAVRERPSG